MNDNSEMRQNGRFPGLTLALLIALVVLVGVNLKIERRQKGHERVPRRSEVGAIKWRLPWTVQRAKAERRRELVTPRRDTSRMSRQEETTIGIYHEVSPSVVSVVNRALVRSGFFGLQVVEVPQGAGSGFVWDRLGHIISNYHVIHQATALTVAFPDGSSYPARVVGVAPDYDIAVLKIDAPTEQLKPVPLGESHSLQVGQSVYAIGNPFGLDTTLTVGVVSALGRNITSMTQRRIQDVIQTDAAINPGNSGGPLLDSNGQLIGINTAILSPSGAYAGIGFAVPSDTVSRVVPQLIVKGKVSRAGLGVQLMPPHISQRFRSVTGVPILNVLPDSPAEAAGLKGVSTTESGEIELGHIITAIAGREVERHEDVSELLERYRPGDRVEVTVHRVNKPSKTVTVRLGEL